MPDRSEPESEALARARLSWIAIVGSIELRDCCRETVKRKPWCDMLSHSGGACLWVEALSCCGFPGVLWEGCARQGRGRSPADRPPPQTKHPPLLHLVATFVADPYRFLVTDRMEPTLLSSRTLPSAHTLPPTAVCPTSHLLVLQNAEPSSSSPAPAPAALTQPKLTLIRQTGAMDQVWDWTPPAPPAPPADAPAPGGKPLNRLQMMRDKGKGKATSGGEIKAIAWSRNGEHGCVT